MNLNQEDKVSNRHPSYGIQQAKRDVFHAVENTDTIRAGGESYLPKYPAESDSDYKIRLCSSTLDGLTYNGVDVLSGSVFYEEIDTSKVNATIQPLLENIDNEGNNFNVFCRDAFKAAFDGFSVIAIDAPAVPNDMAIRSLEDERRFGLRPYWRLYKADDVINWRFSIDPISKVKRLELIVFREIVSEKVARFTEKPVTYYRVWEAVEGRITWQVWKESGDAVQMGSTTVQLIREGSIDGQAEIPVAFIGDVMDDPWLLTEARLEIKAYQKESSFDMIEYLSCPTFYTKGYEGEERISLGASAHVKMPIDGEVGYAQIDSGGLAELKATIVAIKDTIRTKVADLVTVETGQAFDETATAAIIKDRDKQARLIVWADNLKDSLERALQITGRYLGLGDDGAGEIVIRTKWLVTEEQAQARFNADREIMTEDTDGNGND